MFLLIVCGPSWKKRINRVLFRWSDSSIVISLTPLLEKTELNPFSVGWAAHRLLEDGVNLTERKYICLLFVLERLSHYSKPPQSSRLYPLLIHHVLIKLHAHNRNQKSQTNVTAAVGSNTAPPQPPLLLPYHRQNRKFY
jgi:hypothetical protein